MLQNIETSGFSLSRILPKLEAEVYNFLLSQAPAKASDIAKGLGLQRQIAYNALERLEQKELVTKHKKPGGVARFNPQHPIHLQQLVESEIREAEIKKVGLNSSLQSLVSQFHLRFGGIPGFRVILGVEGVHELYEDILNENKDILLIRSPQDRFTTELRLVIQKQIEHQVEQGIHTKAITPLKPGIPKSLLDSDKRNLVTRRIVPEDQFMVPAQIIIYANKVGITAYGETLMTTIIENAAIRETFEIMFNYMWEKSNSDNETLLKTVTE